MAHRDGAGRKRRSAGAESILARFHEDCLAWQRAIDAEDRSFAESRGRTAGSVAAAKGEAGAGDAEGS